MSDPTEHLLAVEHEGQEMKLSLWQKPNPGGIPVLLLHGASANHRTFLNPLADPNGHPRCLADWLFERNFEPWLLNWRGNGRIEPKDLERLRQQLDFDRTAELDIPAALRKIDEVSHPERICAVGHCMGAATLAQSIAAGHAGKDQHLTHVVLLTIGLFYEPSFDGRLKSQDHALERLWAADSECFAIDPKPETGWPKELDDIYRNWPASLLPHEQPASAMEEFCNRVSFMFGQPYRERNLEPEAHRGTFLEDQFGTIPLRLYLHAAQNIRRGWAAGFAAENDDDSLVGNAALERFASLDRVTLLTGAKNEIWHRDSIDRMYEWLCQSPAGRDNSHKQIFPDYAHQDLLWGANAYQDVFPKILEGLPSADGAGTAIRTGRRSPDARYPPGG